MGGAQLFGGSAVFLRSDHDLHQAGGTTTLSFGRALVPAPTPNRLDNLRFEFSRVDWTPDLGAQVGSRAWWRGAATCLALCAAAGWLSPGLPRGIVGDVPAVATSAQFDETRAQSIAPLAWGADTGRHLAANDLVEPLAATPERPILQLTATLGQGDAFDHMLERAGVSRSDAASATSLIAGAVAIGDIASGTRVEMTLGRRPNRSVPRPLEKLALRARFDLDLSVARAGNALHMVRHPIAIDHTPLRVQGLVGSSLYRSARAAGVPAKTIETYIKAIATRLAIGRDVGASDSFDIIIEQARAATGEVQTGSLLFAGLDQGRKKTQLVKWAGNQWFEASGQSEQRGAPGMPVTGRITSEFGVRRHPLLGYLRMHKGLDIAAPYGTPIHAAIAGIVAVAGHHSGYGNFVKLAHGGGIASGYGHMSRIAVQPGAHVAQGQVIGFVGSTGMSTGPHLHWEVWRNGVAVNPRAFSFATIATLSGDTLRAFKARVAGLLAIKPGGR